MAPEELTRPWERIETLVQTGDTEELDAFLETLSPFEIARAISRMEEKEQGRLLTLLEPGDAADLIEELSDTQGSDLIEDLPAEQAAAIVDEMESDHRADILQEMEEHDAEAILAEMKPDEAHDARHLLTHPEDSAGGIMHTEFITYPQDLKVRDVLEDLRTHREEYAEYPTQYAYVTSQRGILVGVLRMHDLILAPGDASIVRIMIANPIHVSADTDLKTLEHLFERYVFTGIPVTDRHGRVIGVVGRHDVEEAVGERSERTFMRISGIIRGDELRHMPYSERYARRLAWLSINLVLSVLAASVILLFENTVATVTALAALIPIIGNMCGCAGNQAMAVSIREMALGIIQPADAAYVFWKEVQVALLNGCAIGFFLGVGVTAYSGDYVLGGVVGTAIALNTLIAVAVGGAVPLGLQKLNLDPALAAGPILMTVVDMCGFLLLLGLASVILL